MTTPFTLSDPNDVSVTICNIQIAESVKGYLTREELGKAERFKFREDQWRSITARGVLRLLLSKYLDKIEFGASEYGKPFLRGDSGVEFNVAHSGDFAIVAIARGREIGVDIERIQPEIEVESVAERYFFHEERTWLLSQPSRLESFYRLWTAKESVIKAAGLGLSMPLDSFSVAFADRGEIVVTSQTGFTARELSVSPGYKAALAATGTDPFHLHYGNGDLRGVLL